MRVGRTILLYTLAVLVLGALLAPWAYQVIQAHFPKIPFRRVFDRTILVLALIGLWPLLRSLQIRTWAEIGFVPRQDWWHRAALGAGVGLLSFGIGGALLLACGARAIATGPVHWVGVVVTGGVVAVLEETLFRGAIFNSLRRGMPLSVSILLSSLLYAVVHFLRPKYGVEPAVDWLTGFNHVLFALQSLGTQLGTGLGFGTLVLAGGVLAVALVRSGDLYLSIGLHAGWIMALRIYADVTAGVGGRQWWGGSSLVDNLLMWPILVGLGIVIWRWPRRS